MSQVILRSNCCTCTYTHTHATKGRLTVQKENVGHLQTLVDYYHVVLLVIYLVFHVTHWRIIITSQHLNRLSKLNTHYTYGVPWEALIMTTHPNWVSSRLCKPTIPRNLVLESCTNRPIVLYCGWNSAIYHLISVQKLWVSTLNTLQSVQYS